MVERLHGSYKADLFSRDRLGFRTTIPESGFPHTEMTVYSVLENSENKGHPRCHESMTFPNSLFEKRVIKGDNKWYCPLTDSNVELINHCWPKEQLVFDELSKQLFDEKLILGKVQDFCAATIAKYKTHGILPSSYGLVEKEGKELTDYQKVGRACIDMSMGFALFMDMGTGKTATALNASVNSLIPELKDQERRGKHPFKRVVVICPKNVRYNWETEIETFCPIPFKTTVIRGGPLERQKQLIQAALPSNGERISFVIGSYGALRSSLRQFCLKDLGFPKPFMWDVGILDESHYVKSPRAKRTQAALTLRDACRKRVVLTGTPFVNSLYDLWAQWEFLGKYYSGFTNFNAFKEFHSIYDKNVANTRGKKRIDFDKVPLLQERLARTSFIISQKEALPDLPEKRYDVIEVGMTKAQAKIYKEIAEALFVEIQQEEESELPREMKVNNVLTKLLRLAQVTSGFISWDPVYSDDGEVIHPKRIDRLDPNPKLETLVNELKCKTEQEKTIVWANFEQDIKTISARLTLEGIDNVIFYGKTKDDDRNKAESRFNNDPKCRVFVGNPAAGGVGLNLLGYNYRDESHHDTNCDHEIYYSQGWSLPVRAQSERRAFRRGTRKSVRITDLVVPKSIDTEIRSRVLGKIEEATKMQDVQHILERILNPVLEEAGE